MILGKPTPLDAYNVICAPNSWKQVDPSLEPSPVSTPMYSQQRSTEESPRFLATQRY